jgi:hypothetical protein
MSSSATVTYATSSSPLNSSALPVHTTAFDISEEEGGRVAEGVDAVEGEASRGTQRWIGSAR